jgi:DNA-binding response OmpR family regulator
MRVLIAEDEAAIADALERGLTREGMAVDVASDGERALMNARVYAYDVVVLDRDLPEVHGDDVCRALSAGERQTKILMLTAASGTTDVVDGLSLGADDYMAKPFDFTELVARVRALARRSGPARPPVLTKGDLTLDPASRLVARAGRRIDLSPKEFGVLEVLMGADGRAVPSEELLERVWDENADPFTNSVRMTLVGLRRKLGDPPAIQTVVGSGYRV